MPLLKLFKQNVDNRRTDAHRAILHYVAKIGGEVFGQIPEGRRREFFCLDEHTWVWHEEWNDQTGHHAVTTRYDIRPSGILKSQGAHSYQRLTPQEEQNFRSAVELYYQRVRPELERLALAA